MKKIMLTLAVALTALCAVAQSKVYFTRNISPESLVKIYEALGVKAHGRVAVKISTGEAGNNHYLKPELIANLVDKVNGTIVECNTAYGGSRQDIKKHWQTIHEHGFDSRFAVDIMDEFGEVRIPVKDRKHLNYDIVGDHLGHYNFMINLAHFKGHAMGGFGGVLKNASIGVASTAGKAYKLFFVSSVQFSCSVVSDSLRPHELQHARLPCPTPTPGAYSNSCPSSQRCHPAISSSVGSFSSCLNLSQLQGLLQ